MKTVILCGGLGTRIRDVAVETPKPLVPIGPYPILYHLMNYYSMWGHKDFVLCLGYKSKDLVDYFNNFQLYNRDATFSFGKENKVELHGEPLMQDWNVTMAHTGIYSLTGTRVSRIRQYVGDDEYFMLTYADGLSDVNIGDLVEFHKSHGKLMTVTGVVPPGRFGEMLSDDTGMVESFAEKPTQTCGLVSGGFFVCSREVFDYLPEGGDYMLEHDPMQKLAADGQMMVRPHHGFWHPMDTPRDYKLMNRLYDEGDAPWTKRS